jgi:outer membrane cobalamin receptor
VVILGRIVRAAVVTVSSLLLFFSGFALCQGEDEKTGIYTLGEVVVKAEREGVESIGTVREIKAEDIRNKGARTLEEALKLLPGVNIRTGADGVPRVDIRGFRSRHVILLLNGIPFNSTYDAQFDPSIIATENIAKIKISYGTHSVSYGQGGLGGVINIVTKKGKDGIHGELLGEAGEQDRQLGQATLYGGQGRANFFLSASALDTDGFRLSDDFDATPLEDGGLRENNDEERKNLFANLGFGPFNNLEIGLVLNYLQGEFGKPPITVDKNMDPDFGKNPKYERVEDYEGYSGQLSLKYDVSDLNTVRGWAFLNHLEEETKQYDDANYDSVTQNGSFKRDDETLISGGTLQGLFNVGSTGLFTVGASVERQDYEADGFEIKKKGTNQIDIDKDIHLYSAYMEYEVLPFEQLGLVLGYSHHWLEKDDGGDDDKGAFLAGAHYDIWRNTRIRGSVARKIRFPSIRQLYEPDSGDPDLTTEESYNYELGIEQKLPLESTVSLVGFLSDVDDYIEKLPPDDRFKNNDEYRFLGFELTAESRAIDNLFLRAGYTYLDSEDRSSGSERDELQYRPEHKFAFEGMYRFDMGFSIYLNVLRVARQYDYSNTVPLEKRRMNDYTIFNMKLDQDLFRGRTGLYLGVDNLFDEDYEESFGFPQAGRTVYGGAKISF